MLEIKKQNLTRVGLENRTKKAIIAAKIDHQVYIKNLAKHALRKEINALNVEQIFSLEQRDKIEIGIKVQS